MESVPITLAFLIDYLPSQLHLVILTRADPALPLPRLRARGSVTELHASDLRFTHDEAATFLNQVMGLALTAADQAALEARTEGWVAGRRRDDAADAVDFFLFFFAGWLLGLAEKFFGLGHQRGVVGLTETLDL